MVMFDGKSIKAVPWTTFGTVGACYKIVEMLRNGFFIEEKSKFADTFGMNDDRSYSCSRLCLTKEKSKSTPVPRRKTSRTSRQVVSK